MMQHVPGPDFPTGGIINGAQEFATGYRTGLGRLSVRARVVIEEVGSVDRFFFLAEDGIRDLTVTGVQTCALPIWTTSNENVGELGEFLDAIGEDLRTLSD